MSEAPTPEPFGGPASRPSGEGLPPGSGGDGLRRPNGEDSVDPGVGVRGDVGEDTGDASGEL